MEKPMAGIAGLLFSMAAASFAVPPLTFLDTLNKGREVAISSADFSQQATVPVSLPALTQAPLHAELRADTASGQFPAEQKREAGVVPSHYKIQILAGTQEQQIKKEKTNLAMKINLEKINNLPISISFETPYYKLFAGDFALRSEAENYCAHLKKIGYTDAWIVRTAVSQR